MCVYPKVIKNQTPPGSVQLGLSRPPSFFTTLPPLQPHREKVDRHPPTQVAVTDSAPGRVPALHPHPRPACLLGRQMGGGAHPRGEEEAGGLGRKGDEIQEKLNRVARGHQRRAMRTPRSGGGGGAALRQSVAPAWEVASGIHVNQRAQSQWEGAEGAGLRRVPLRAGSAKRAGESWREQGEGGERS